MELGTDGRYLGGDDEVLFILFEGLYGYRLYILSLSIYQQYKVEDKSQ